jgi:hypothetical protein
MDACSEARSLYALALCNGYGMPKEETKAAELWSTGTVPFSIFSTVHSLYLLTMYLSVAKDCYSQCEWGQVRSNNADPSSAKRLFELGIIIFRSFVVSTLTCSSASFYFSLQ